MPYKKRKVTHVITRLLLSKPFRIAGYEFTDAPAVIVSIQQDDCLGRGEAAGVYYLGESVESMVKHIKEVTTLLEAGMTRDELLLSMPAGGARNAIDCALWELEAQLSRCPVWERAGLRSIRPLLTTFTLGVDEPSAMRDAAIRFDQARALKIKLNGDVELDIERVCQVRTVRPDCWIGIDANQAYTLSSLTQVLPHFVDCGVALIEQPLARGFEAELENFDSPIPIAADESVLTHEQLPGLVGRFDVINIKLDKCGGLTEALAMARQAGELGFDVMVGNMVGSSLAMAPAFILGQLCKIVDLDGPTFIAQEPEPTVVYKDGQIWCPETVWGRSSRQIAA